MQDIKDVFNYLDSSKSGSIDLKELPTAFRCIGLNPTVAEIQELSQEASTTDGKLTIEELQRLYNRLKSTSADTKEEVQKFLKTFDNGDGLVDVKELKNALCHSGDALEEKDVEAVLSDFTIIEGKLKISDLFEGLFKTK